MIVSPVEDVRGVLNLDSLVDVVPTEVVFVATCYSSSRVEPSEGVEAVFDTLVFNSLDCLEFTETLLKLNVSVTAF